MGSYVYDIMGRRGVWVWVGLDWIRPYGLRAWAWACVWDVTDDTPWVADHAGVLACCIF